MNLNRVYDEITAWAFAIVVALIAAFSTEVIITTFAPHANLVLLGFITFCIVGAFLVGATHILTVVFPSTFRKP